MKLQLQKNSHADMLLIFYSISANICAAVYLL